MSEDITERLRDYASDYTTTTYHDDLIREAVTEIESLRQQVTLLRDVLKFYMDNGICEPFYHRVAEALSATKQKP